MLIILFSKLSFGGTVVWVEVMGRLVTANWSAMAEFGLFRYHKGTPAVTHAGTEEGYLLAGSAGASTATAKRRAGLSPAICASWSRSPSAIAATACQSPR